MSKNEYKQRLCELRGGDTGGREARRDGTGKALLGTLEGAGCWQSDRW